MGRTASFQLSSMTERWRKQTVLCRLTLIWQVRIAKGGTSWPRCVDGEEAKAAFAKALELDPTFENDGIIMMALCAAQAQQQINELGKRAFLRGLQSDDHQKAYDLYTEAISKSPNPNSALHEQRAGALMAMQRFDDALAETDRAVQINPQSTGAHRARGAVLLAISGVTGTKRWEEAKAAYEKVLELDPSDANGRKGVETCAAAKETFDADTELRLAMESTETTLQEIRELIDKHEARASAEVLAEARKLREKLKKKERKQKKGGNGGEGSSSADHEQPQPQKRDGSRGGDGGGGVRSARGDPYRR